MKFVAGTDEKPSLLRFKLNASIIFSEVESFVFMFVPKTITCKNRLTLRRPSYNSTISRGRAFALYDMALSNDYFGQKLVQSNFSDSNPYNSNFPLQFTVASLSQYTH